MTAPVVDPVAQPILDDLLTCLEVQVARVPDPPQAVCLRPGDRVALLISQNFDECCAGLAWVRLVTIYPSSEFPEPDETVRKCQNGWAVVVELGVARCAPVGDETNLPTCDDWTAVTNKTTADAAALRRTLLCFRALPAHRFTNLIPGAWEAATLEGGCVGGTMTLTVQAPMCDVLED